MKKNYFLLTFLFLNLLFKAQDLDLKWSEQLKYDNKADGFFTSFIDQNSHYIYAKFTNLSISLKKQYGKIKLVALDKNTMKKAFDVALIGFKENKSHAKEFKKLEYYKTVVLENRVYVFWIKESKGKEELFVQTFDSKLKPENKLKKIFEAEQSKSSKAKNYQSILVLSNRMAGEKIIIGTEHGTEKNENVKFEYKVLNSDLTFSDANNIPLPVKLTSKSYGIASRYEFGDDGNLYIRSFVSMTKEEKKNAKKNESTSYSIFSMVDIKTGNLTPFTMKFENKNIFDFGYTIEKTGVKVYAFFCDLNKDTRGSDMHGIFYCVLDNKSFTMKSQNFAYFDKATLDKLFANDKEDKKKSKGLFKSKKSQKSDEESLDSRYEIENVQSIDHENLVLFCTKMYNYKVTTCTPNSNGGQSCTTSYYCEKDNVTAFKIGSEGKIIWASNLDRKITYSGWDVYDLKVINKNGKYYALYGSDFQSTAKKKNFFARKSAKQSIDKFEYAVFDDANGNYQKKEFQVNAVNEKQKKAVDPVNVTIMDNQFFVNYEKIKMKTGAIIGTCATAIVCLPAIYFFIYNGNTRKGTGNLGTIKPIK